MVMVQLLRRKEPKKATKNKEEATTILGLQRLVEGSRKRRRRVHVPERAQLTRSLLDTKSGTKICERLCCVNLWAL